MFRNIRSTMKSVPSIETYLQKYFIHPSQSYFKLLFNETTGLVLFLNSNPTLKRLVQQFECK